MKGQEAAFLVGLLILEVILFLALWLAGQIVHRKRSEERYSILTHFPFELVGEGVQASPLLRVLAVAFSSVDALSFAYPLLCGDRFLVINPLLILILALAMAKALATIGIFFVPAYHFKTHLLCFVFLGTLTVLSSVSCASAFLNLHAMSETIPTIFAVILFVFAAFGLVVMLNPKLSKWTQMNLEVGEDGSMNPIRPKPFPLAFAEWSFVLVGMLIALTYVLGLGLVIISL